MLLSPVLYSISQGYGLGKMMMYDFVCPTNNAHLLGVKLIGVMTILVDSRMVNAGKLL